MDTVLAAADVGHHHDHHLSRGHGRPHRRASVVASVSCPGVTFAPAPIAVLHDAFDDRAEAAARIRSDTFTPDWGRAQV